VKGGYELLPLVDRIPRLTTLLSKEKKKRSLVVGKKCNTIIVRSREWRPVNSFFPDKVERGLKLNSSWKEKASQRRSKAAQTGSNLGIHFLRRKIIARLLQD